MRTEPQNPRVKDPQHPISFLRLISRLHRLRRGVPRLRGYRRRLLGRGIAGVGMRQSRLRWLAWERVAARAVPTSRESDAANSLHGQQSPPIDCATCAPAPSERYRQDRGLPRRDRRGEPGRIEDLLSQAEQRRGQAGAGRARQMGAEDESATEIPRRDDGPTRILGSNSRGVFCASHRQ